jgi:lipopolysaccharide export system protein LptA
MSGLAQKTIAATIASVLAVMALGGLAQAQAPLGRAQNSDQPIEITSDILEVEQDKQLAIFSGNVDAVQGDIRLRADQLRVFYRQDNKSGSDAKQPAGRAGGASSGGADASAISRIDALGQVFVSSLDETAKGDRGVYDVERRVIVIEGRVVLTRGKNVLRGDKATMNLDTGRSVMDAVPGARVRGLFVPSERTQKPP